MRSIFTLVVVLSIFNFTPSHSQSKRELYQGAKAEKISKFAEEVVLDDKGNTTYIKFKRNVKINSENDLLRSFKLSQQSRFKIKSEKADKLGYVHQTYVQEYKGFEILGSEIKLHSKGDLPTTATGKVFSDLNINTELNLSEAEALDIALNSVGAKNYMWENDQNEAFLKKESKDPNASYYPIGKQLISREKYQAEYPFTLVYQFDIYASDPLGKYIVEVSAIDGSIINKYDVLHHEGVSGTGLTLYDGDVDIDIDQVGDDYHMSELLRGDGVHTYDMMNGTSYGSAGLFTEADSYFNESNSQAGVSAHFGAEATYDYFMSNFGRDSYDDNGAAINSYVHYGNNYFNAFWDGFRMTYGDGDGVTATALVSLDIVGHEIAHAVTQHSANLVYAYEPGALNESFSDIFGQSIEFEAFPATASWNLADQIYTDGVSMIRSMSDPNSQNQPDTYLGDMWYNGSGDNGGVHYNSGVQNFWYYLLVEGGTGTNDNGYDYDVTSIGLEDAQQIAYRNLTVYLTSNSEYIDARAGAELAAIDLFGHDSQQFLSVVEAWNAVGVPSATPTLSLPDDLDFGTTVENETKSIDLSVSNTGLGFLSVTDVVINDARFTVDETAFTVAESSTYQLPVHFTPDGLGDFEGLLIISSNAGIDTVDLTGEGVEHPSYSISENSLSFDLLIGNSASSSVSISNNNNYDLNFTINSAATSQFAPLLVYQKSNDVIQVGKTTQALYQEIQVASLSGEDAGGLYYWRDSDSGAAFSWYDISGLGAAASLSDDANTSLLDMGFSFPFYENSFETVSISSNGWISFTNTDGSIWNVPLPSAVAPENVISIMSTDLYPGSGSCHYYQDTENGRFIIQYSGWTDYSSQTGNYTMQIQLYSNGKILLLYDDIANPVGATIGIQNQSKTEGMTISYNNDSFFSSNYAIEIGFVNSWLSTSVETLAIPAGGESSFDVQVNAEDILAGDFEGEIILVLPDFGLTEDTIAVAIHAVGAPNIEVEGELTFEDAFVGHPAIDSIEIFNVGTDLLELTDIHFLSGANFSVAQTELSVTAQSSSMLDVTFSPPASGNFSDSLIIATNDTLESVVKLYVEGNALEAPAIAVSPGSIEENLLSGDSSVQVLTIDNSAGGSQLDWELSILTDLENEFSAREHKHPKSIANLQGGVVGKISEIQAGTTSFNIMDSLLTFDEGTDGLTLGGHMGWDARGGGHLYCDYWDDDDYIYFPAPTNIQSFKMNAMPWENYGGGNVGKIDVNGYDISGDTLWSTTVDLTNYTNWDQWYTVEVNTKNIYYLEFKAPGVAPWNNGFWPSIDSVRIGLSNNFIYADVSSGSVASGENVDIDISFNATGLYGGIYEAELQISSNDPSSPIATVPATLQVTGAPDISAELDTIDFGVVFASHPKIDTIRISNEGTDSLAVTSIVINNPDFTVDTASFGLQPETYLDLEITYTPSVAEVDDVAMWILSNDPNEDTLTVYLKAAAHDPPIISVNPESLSESLLSGDSSVHVLTIDNSTGGSQLDWEMSILTSVENEFLAREHKLRQSKEKPTLGVTGNTSEIKPVNQRFDILDSLLTFDDGTNGLSLGGNMVWNSNGGGHLFCEAYNDDDYIYFPLPSNILSFKMNGLPWEGYGSGNIGKIDINGYNSSGDTIWSTTVDLTDYTSWDSWKTVEVNTEEVYYLEFKAPGQAPWNNGFWPSIDSLQFGRSSSFVYSDVYSGATASGEDVDVDITFNAKGLFGGIYEAELQITSNDPLNPIVGVPLTLDVSGIPDIATERDSIDFGTVFLGLERVDTLRIMNEGTDSLGVTSIVIENPDYTVDRAAFGIQPSEYVDILISYNPSAEENDDISLWLLSNDPDEDTLTVILSGVGLAPPVIAVNPESFDEALMVEDSSTQLLTIDNSAGGSVLNYQINITGQPQAEIVAPAERFVGSEIVADDDKKEIQSTPESRFTQGVESVRSHQVKNSFTSAELEEVRDNLDASFESITDLIPEKYNFSGGETGNNIGDGGRDMYDGGNYLNTNLGGYIPYTNGAISSDHYLGNESYFTAKYPGLFVFAANTSAINSFNTSGNLGADGGGASDGSVISMRKGSKQFLGFIKRVYSAGDPSVNHLIVMEYSEGSSQTFDPHTNRDFHEVAWTDPIDRIYYLLFAGDDAVDGGYYINDDAMLLIMDSFLDVVGGHEGFLRLDRESGSIAAGSSEDVEVSFFATDLNGGLYQSGISIQSNDSLNPKIDIPVTLQVTGIPDIQASREALDFGSMFVGTEKADSLTIYNMGTDSLGISSIVFENADFEVDVSSFGLQPGEFKKLEVLYTPGEVEVDNGAMWILSNDPSQDTLTVALTGEGLNAPTMLIDTYSLYENLLIGDSSVHMVNISNPGGADLFVNSTIINRYEFKNENLPSNGIESSISKTSDRESITPRRSITGDESVLIIQDWNSWGLNMYDFIQENFGISATVINASDLSVTDLSLYEIVITCGDQGTSYYSTISANADRFEEYVSNGGILQYQLATQGVDVDLPGGAIMEFGELERNNMVVDELHAIVYDLPVVLSGNYTNHGYLSNLPEDAHVLVETADTQLPTLVEYTIGSGKIIATGMTVEYLHNYSESAGPILGRMFEYSAFSIGAGWLTTELSSDTIPAGSSVDYEFYFNTKDLGGGSFFKDVILTSNDPQLSEFVIPVELLVDTFRVYESHEFVEICFGETHYAEGAEQSESGMYYDTLHFVNYDSLFVTHLTVFDLIDIEVDIELCEGEVYIFGSQLISEAGTYTETFSAINSCDSTVHVTAHINPTYDVVHSEIICDGSSFTFGTQTLTTAGMYIETFASQSGCDSTVFLSLEIAPIYEENTSLTICSGETFNFGNQILSTSGQFAEMFNSKSGCDSLVTLNLTVEKIDSTIILDGRELLVAHNNATYQWMDFNDNMRPIDNEVNQRFTPPYSGDFVVQISTEHCSVVSQAFKVDVVTALKDEEMYLELKAFPSPTDGPITVQLNRTINSGRYYIIDFGGKIIESKNVLDETDEIQLNIQGSSGIYLFRLIDQDDQVYSTKISKR